MRAPPLLLMKRKLSEFFLPQSLCQGTYRQQIVTNSSRNETFDVGFECNLLSHLPLWPRRSTSGIDATETGTDEGV